VTGHEDEPDWIMHVGVARRAPATDNPDGGTSTFEIICRTCGDDPAVDHRQAPAELRRIRGSYTLTAGIAAFLEHQEFHDRAEDAETGQAGTRVLVSPATVRAQIALTYRELAAATRRQAIACARKLGLLGLGLLGQARIRKKSACCARRRESGGRPWIR
jgi:hypothetical protein